jgi:hypothetical protein
MTKPPTNFAASARARLLNIAKARKGEFQLTLQRYVAERFLYRLGVSPHRDRFVLKGAMLFVLWDAASARSTRDLDLAGFWGNDADSLAAAFREICAIPCPRDGLDFAIDTLELTPIRDANEYHGFRLLLDVRLAGAVIRFQVDVGFGDAIVPPPIDVVYPALLDTEAPRVRAYPREAVVAEKLHAMVSLGEANTRFKDFFDVWTLSSRFSFEGERLSAAIQATFSRRKTGTSSTRPEALAPAFYAEPVRGEQWLSVSEAHEARKRPSGFRGGGERVMSFLGAPWDALGAASEFAREWPAGGPWENGEDVTS